MIMIAHDDMRIVRGIAEAVPAKLIGKVDNMYALGRFVMFERPRKTVAWKNIAFRPPAEPDLATVLNQAVNRILRQKRCVCDHHHARAGCSDAPYRLAFCLRQNG